MPVNAMSRHSIDVRGSGIFCMLMRTKRIATDKINLADAKVTGGRSSRPILIKIQVEPQIKHRISQTRALSENILGIFVKTQARFALFQNAPATQNADAVRQSFFIAVLDDEHSAFVQEMILFSEIVKYQ